jgi:uncharacterized protein YqeY
MSTILERVQADTRDAMKAGERERVSQLRMLANALQQDAKMGDGDEVATLQRERKKRLEAAEAFRDGDRPEQAAQEELELSILQEFMPEPLEEEELERIVDDAIAENGATSLRDMGRVMADVMPQVAGRADGSAVGQLVREKLA